MWRRAKINKVQRNLKTVLAHMLGAAEMDGLDSNGFYGKQIVERANIVLEGYSTIRSPTVFQDVAMVEAIVGMTGLATTECLDESSNEWRSCLIDARSALHEYDDLIKAKRAQDEANSPAP